VSSSSCVRNSRKHSVVWPLGMHLASWIPRRWWSRPHLLTAYPYHHRHLSPSLAVDADDATTRVAAHAWTITSKMIPILQLAHRVHHEHQRQSISHRSGSKPPRRSHPVQVLAPGVKPTRINDDGARHWPRNLDRTRCGCPRSRGSWRACPTISTAVDTSVAQRRIRSCGRVVRTRWTCLIPPGCEPS